MKKRAAIIFRFFEFGFDRMKNLRGVGASLCKSESAVKGLRVEIFVRKYYPSLDRTERHTSSQRERLVAFPSATRRVRVWAEPRIKFRVSPAAYPFLKGY